MKQPNIRHSGPLSASAVIFHGGRVTEIDPRGALESQEPITDRLFLIDPAGCDREFC